MKNVNELHDMWTKRGQNVAELQNKLVAAASDDSITTDQVKQMKDELAKETDMRNRAENAYKIAQTNTQTIPVKDNKSNGSVNPKVSSAKNFGENVRNLATGRPINDATTAPTNGIGSQIDAGINGGLTIPVDQDTAINQLLQAQTNFQNYVRVENVSTSTGSRIVGNRHKFDGLVPLNDEFEELTETQFANVSKIEYKIQDYGNIAFLSNDLLLDSADNISGETVNQFGEKASAGRNKAIVDELGKPNKKITLSKWDDVIDVTNSLDIAVAGQPGTVIFTNQSGYAVLSKVKDAKGRPLMTPDVTNPNVFRANGYEIVRMPDIFLPDVNGSHPFIFGNLREGIFLFDRQNKSLMVNPYSDRAFSRNAVAMRMIDRFDVEVRDADAWVYGSFKDIADSVPVISGSTTPGK